MESVLGGDYRLSIQLQGVIESVLDLSILFAECIDACFALLGYLIALLVISDGLQLFQESALELLTLFPRGLVLCCESGHLLLLLSLDTLYLEDQRLVLLLPGLLFLEPAV